PKMMQNTPQKAPTTLLMTSSHVRRTRLRRSANRHGCTPAHFAKSSAGSLCRAEIVVGNALRQVGPLLASIQAALPPPAEVDRRRLLQLCFQLYSLSAEPPRTMRRALSVSPDARASTTHVPSKR